MAGRSIAAVAKNFIVAEGWVCCCEAKVLIAEWLESEKTGGCCCSKRLDVAVAVG